MKLLPETNCFLTAGSGEKKGSQAHPAVSFRVSKLTTRYSYFDNKKVSKMEARASREAQRGR